MLLEWSAPALLGIAALAAVTFFYRLGLALRLYLRFDRPWATVFAAQIIVALTTVLILLWVFVASYP